MPTLCSCPICHALGIRAHAVCCECQERLLEIRRPMTRVEESFYVRSLFAWEPGRSNVFGWLVHGLKKKESPRYWLEFSSWMLRAFGPELSFQPTLVPIPAHGRNHALGLARALHGWTGWPIKEVLKIETATRPQKELSREARAQTRFGLTETVGQDVGFLILDDVVTTGATLRAAFRALGEPKTFQAWCLTDRRPCGDKDALL